VLARLATELLWSREPERRESLIRESLEIARRVGDHDALATAIGAASWWLPENEEIERRLSLADEIVELASAAGDKRAEFYGRSVRLGFLLERGDAADVDCELEAYQRLAAEIRQPFHLGNAARWRAARALWQGRLDEARALAWEGFNFAGRVDTEQARQAFGAYLYFRRRMQGKLGEVEPALRDGVERFPAATIWRCLLACMYAETGREAEARREFEHPAREDLVRQWVDPNYVSDLVLLADVCGYLRDGARAEILYDRLLPFAGSNTYLVNVGARDCTSRALGVLAATMVRWDDAQTHFEQALELDRRLGARACLPRTQCDYARMLLDRGAPGDRERALALLSEAMHTSGELGLKGWLDLALDLKLQAQGVDSGSVDRSIDRVASSIGVKRPDLSTQAAPDGTVTLMFSDMEGFTSMTERLGDLRARDVIGGHNRIVREQLELHGGYEVELQGDGFLLAFGSARKALLCAIALQRAFATYSREHVEEPIRVRIGLHTGEALKDADKFFGKTVILASRIAAQAQGGEILVSSLLRELTDSAGDIRFGASREADLKGISERQRLVAVEWE
jgi:class 3 adenylate cyclase